MMLALGAATSAIDSLFGLVSAKQTPSAGSGQSWPRRRLALCESRARILIQGR